MQKLNEFISVHLPQENINICVSKEVTPPPHTPVIKIWREGKKMGNYVSNVFSYPCHPEGYMAVKNEEV